MTRLTRRQFLRLTAMAGLLASCRPLEKPITPTRTLAPTPTPGKSPVKTGDRRSVHGLRLLAKGSDEEWKGLRTLNTGDCLSLTSPSLHAILVPSLHYQH